MNAGSAETVIPGLTRRSVLDLFTNPLGLMFEIDREEGGNRYNATISRGDKKIFMSKNVFESLDSAAEKMGRFLGSVMRAGEEIYAGKPIDRSVVLNPALIEQIVTQLKLHGVTKIYRRKVETP